MSTGKKVYSELQGLSYGFLGGPFFDVAAKSHVRFEELKYGHIGQPFVGSRKVDNAAVTFTDNADTISATATVVTNAAVTFTDDTDTISADALVVAYSAIAFSDADDTISATAVVVTNAAIAFSDDDDTISATVAVVTSVYVDIADDADTIDATAFFTTTIDSSVADDDDTLSATATVTGGETPPVIPTGVHGGSSSQRPYRSQFTTTYLAGDAHVTRYARLKVILDGVTCKAYAQVGRNERARTKRRAAIAMLIG